MAVANQGEFTMDVRDVPPPAHLLMKIESFNELSKHKINEIKSKEFLAGNHKWRLIIYPQDSGGSDASVFLSVVGIAGSETLREGWEVTVDFTILLHNQLSDDYFCFRRKAPRFDEKNSRWGFSISAKMLAEVFAYDGNCTFGAEVFPRKADVNECLSFHGWKISNFSKLGDVWNSEEFFAGGYRWKMKLYPNGSGDAKGKSVSVYLEYVEYKGLPPPEKVEADFCIRIKREGFSYADAASQHASCSFSSQVVSSGFHNFIPIADMRDPRVSLMVNDCCSLEVEISVQDAISKPTFYR